MQLADEERAQLRARKQLEEEAEAARRRKVTVTLDLLGRRVLVADDPAAGMSFATGAAGSSSSSSGQAAAAGALLRCRRHFGACGANDFCCSGAHTAGVIGQCLESQTLVFC